MMEYKDCTIILNDNSERRKVEEKISSRIKEKFKKSILTSTDFSQKNAFKVLFQKNLFEQSVTEFKNDKVMVKTPK